MKTVLLFESLDRALKLKFRYFPILISAAPTSPFCLYSAQAFFVHFRSTLTRQSIYLCFSSLLLYPSFHQIAIFLAILMRGIRGEASEQARLKALREVKRRANSEQISWNQR